MLDWCNGLWQAWKTRNVEPPAFFFFDLARLDRYLQSAGYRWEKTDFGVRGTLERGLGRTFVVEWHSNENALVAVSSSCQRFLFWQRRHESRTKTTFSDRSSTALLAKTFQSLVARAA